MPEEKSSSTISKTQIVFGLLIISSVFLYFSHTATQDIAKLFNYHPSLGSPILYGFYLPWEWINWYSRISPNAIGSANEIIKNNFIYASAIILVVALFKLFIKTGAKDQSKGSNLQGSATFASKKDIKDMGLIKTKSGVFLGSYNDKILQDDTDAHVLLAAQTGSGKGVSVIIPTLLTHTGSTIVYDIKRENWQLTSKWRKLHAGNNVIRFEPSSNDGTAASYNPLIDMRLNTEHDVQDAQNLGAIIMDVDPSSMSGDSAYFVTAANSLMVAYILHSAYKALNSGKIPSLPAVADTLSDPNLDQKALLQEMITTPHRTNPDIPYCDLPHDLVVREATSLIQMIQTGAGKQFQGIQGQLAAKMSLYQDPIIRKNLERSDFRIDDLVNNKKPTTLYICINSTDKERLGPIVKLLLTQIIRVLTAEVKYKDGVVVQTHKHKLLMLIDEFPSLGKMPIMNEAIAFLRGFGIRCLLVIQDYGQLKSEAAYGRDEAISANSAIHVNFTPTHFETAEIMSKKIGKATVASASINLPQSSLGKNSGSSTSISTTGRELLTPDELLRMGRIRKAKKWLFKTIMIPGECLIFISGYKPIFGKQLLFFQNKVLNARAKLGALEISDKLPMTVQKASPGVQKQIDKMNSPEAELKRVAEKVLQTVDFSKEPLSDEDRQEEYPYDDEQE